MAGGASLFAGSRVIPLVEDEPGDGRVEDRWSTQCRPGSRVRLYFPFSRVKVVFSRVGELVSTTQDLSIAVDLHRLEKAQGNGGELLLAVR